MDQLNLSRTARTKKQWAEFLLTLLVYAYFLVVVGIWLLIRFGGDRWWFATLLTYGPRWIYAAPLVLLIPPALILRIRLIVPLAICGLIALFSLMGLCIPWRTFAGSPTADLRILSYNIQRYNVAGESFAALLDREQPDVVAVQECAGVGRWTDWWPRHEEWHTAQRGELMVASKFPITRVEYSFSQWPPSRMPPLNAMYCVISTPQGDIGFGNVHVDTPRRALSAVLDRESIINLNNAHYANYRLECRGLESRDLSDWFAAFPEPKIIAGDFNMTSDSVIFRRDWKPRRNAFHWAGWGFGFTKQTVIRRRLYGLRIDHVLTDLSWTPTRSWVGPDMGSDHVPLFADIARR